MRRISAIAVAAGGIGAALSLATVGGGSLVDRLHILRGGFFVYALLCVIPVIFLCYGCCRIFLVVEAFISIRELPIDAYKTAAWTQLLPHL